MRRPSSGPRATGTRCPIRRAAPTERKRRSASPPADMQAVTGRIFARTPVLRSRAYSASGVKNVLMLFAVMTFPAAGSRLDASA